VAAQRVDALSGSRSSATCGWAYDVLVGINLLREGLDLPG
jgi:excinuclease UvrABC helicase subunit UvrB